MAEPRVVGFDLNVRLEEDENGNLAFDLNDAILDNGNGNGFDLNLPLDEFGAVDFDYVQNLPEQDVAAPIQVNIQSMTCLKKLENKCTKHCWLEARMANQKRKIQQLLLINLECTLDQFSAYGS